MNNRDAVRLFVYSSFSAFFGWGVWRQLGGRRHYHVGLGPRFATFWIEVAIQTAFALCFSYLALAAMRGRVRTNRKRRRRLWR